MDFLHLSDIFVVMHFVVTKFDPEPQQLGNSDKDVTKTCNTLFIKLWEFPDHY